MKNILFTASLVIAAGCCIFLSGCGQPKVSGTVKYEDGSPLTSGTVVFSDSKYQASGQIDSQGRYELFSLKKGDGVPAGKYQVSVSASTGGGSDGTPMVKLLDAKFENPATSGLICEVKGSTVFNITVTKPTSVKKK